LKSGSLPEVIGKESGGYLSIKLEHLSIFEEKKQLILGDDDLNFEKECFWELK
jgi:hypothetical protein